MKKGVSVINPEEKTTTTLNKKIQSRNGFNFNWSNANIRCAKSSIC